jgi:hypothetical protein
VRIGRLSRLWPSRRRRDADECYRCRTSFAFSRGHYTRAESPLLQTEPFGAWPLCRRCWRDLSPRERLPYYQRFWLAHRGPNPRENQLVWAAIEAAVLAGA